MLPAFQATSSDTVGTGSQSSGRKVTPGGSNALIESGSKREAQTFLHELEMAEHVVGSRDGMHADSCLAIQIRGGIVQRRRQPTLHRDAGQIVEALHGDCFAASERMVRRQHDDDLLAEELHGFEAIGLERPAHESDVEGARLEGRRSDRRRTCCAGSGEDRAYARHERPQRGQDAHVRRWKRADRQLARAPIGGLLREPPGMLDSRENVFRLLQEDASGVGQRDVLPAAVEQFTPTDFSS